MVNKAITTDKRDLNIQASKKKSAKACLEDRLTAVEEFEFPGPLVLPATALEDYAAKFPKSVRGTQGNGKGCDFLFAFEKWNFPT